jgi:hypothetical protein
MKIYGFGVCILFILLSTPIQAQENRQEQLKFKPGGIITTIKDTIKGDQTVDYQFHAGAEQSITVN